MGRAPENVEDSDLDPTIAAIVVAAGRGTRATPAESPTTRSAPKQYVAIGGEPVLTHTLRALLAHPRIAHALVVIHPDDTDLYSMAVARLTAGQKTRLLPPAAGGATRQVSVANGLDALAAIKPAHVLIHDAARPFITQAVIDRLVAALQQTTGAIAAEPLADTLKRAGGDGRITETIDRSGLWRAQTPQGFAFAAIHNAHRRAQAAGRIDFTDDAAIAEWAGLDVAVVRGEAANIKLTTAEDIAMAAHALDRAQLPDIRTGQGFDVHRFTNGDHVWIGGVRIAHTHALDGHSDADVALHALTDALLGAIGDGDIGQHFPPSDPQWRGAASHLFLADARRRVEARGARITNVDVTIMCEAPRIGPHRPAMQARIGEILGLPPDRVGVKATTTEQLGFTGRREGIAALAIATVIRPVD